MPMENNKESWHLDKKVPVALVVTLLFQFASGIWFISGLRKDLDQIKEARAAEAVVQHERDERQDRASGAAQDKLDKRLDTIDSKLDRLIERLTK